MQKVSVNTGRTSTLTDNWLECYVEYDVLLLREADSHLRFTAPTLVFGAAQCFTAASMYAHEDNRRHTVNEKNQKNCKRAAAEIQAFFLRYLQKKKRRKELLYISETAFLTYTYRGVESPDVRLPIGSPCVLAGP